MSGGATSGTISIPFVYLKARGTNSIPMKKAQLPSNLKTLFKICNRLFQKYGEVKTIYNSDGSVIKDISDVPPGSTLYVSNREANENETIASRQGIFALGRPPESSPNDKDKNLPIENNDSFNALFGNKDGSARKNGKGVFRSREQQLQNESLRRNQEKQNQINQSLERQKKKQEDKKKQQDAEKQRLLDEKRRQEEEERRRRLEEEEEERRRKQEEEEERRRRLEEEEERKRSQKQTTEDYDYDEEDVKINASDYSRKTSNSPRNSARESFRDSPRSSARNSPRDSGRNKDLTSDLSESFDSSFDPQMFLELFSKMLDNEDLNDNVNEELANSDPLIRRFLSLAPQFENEQMANWYCGLYDVFSQIGLPVSFLDKPIRKSNKSNKGENNADTKDDLEANANNQYQNGFNNDDTELYGKKEILQYVRDTIIRHRFVSSQNYIDYNFNIAIIGPRNSGKSNILTCFASEIMKELSVTDNWRKFFLFPINFKVFAPFYEDLSALYATMVDMVVSYLCWQAPFYSQHAAAIKRLFMSSINVQLVGASSSSSASKSQRKSQLNPTTSPTPSMFAKSRAPPVVPKNSLFYRDVPRFALALQKAAQEIFTIWNEPGSISEFLALLYSLPSIVSKAAGFSKVIFFIDNIEFADVEIVPSKPFNQNNDNPVVYNIEIVQYVLSSQHFIITGEEQKRIFESLSPVEEKYYDLENRIDFVSTIGIIKVDESDNRLIKTEIQDEPLPFSFSIEACCGVPAFLQMWVELNDEFDEFEDNDDDDENSEEKEEGQMLLVTHAQQVIDVLFTFDDKSPLFVTSVKRSPKEAEQQSHS